jgi:hypothetical protein
MVAFTKPGNYIKEMPFGQQWEKTIPFKIVYYAILILCAYLSEGAAHEWKQIF